MKKKQVLPILVAVALITLILLIVGVVKLIQKYTPSKEHLSLTEYYNISEESQVAITLNNEVLDTYANMINDKVYTLVTLFNIGI